MSEETTEAPAIPVVPVEDKLEIALIQRDLQEVQANGASLQKRFDELQAKLVAKVTAVGQKLGIDPTKFVLDYKSLDLAPLPVKEA